MPSKSYNGNSPLGGARINSRKGVDSAIGQLSNDIGKRTPKQSMTAGSLQVHNGVFHVPKKPRKAKKYKHPFEVKKSTDGEDYLYVNPGCCLGWIPDVDSSLGSTSTTEKFFAPFVADYKKFTGASVQITEATGFIYVKFDLTREVEGSEGGSEFSVGGGLHRPNEAATLFFFDLAPSLIVPDIDDGSPKDIYVPIAEVSLTDGIASIDFQIIKENIWVELDDIEHTYNPA